MKIFKKNHSNKQKKEETMNARKNQMLWAVILIALAAIMTPRGAMASTAPCTQITNQATLSYSVGGTGQPDITSALDSNNTFYVGVKAIVTVANQDAGNITVTPSTTPAVLKFNVKNDGNATLDFALARAAAANGVASPHGGGNDSFDGTTVGVYVDVDSDGTYSSTVDTATAIDNLAGDGASKTVFVVYTPSDLTASDAALAVYYLTATSQWANGSVISQGTYTPTAAQAGGACDGTRQVEVVFGDGDGPSAADTAARDGIHSDDSAYIVSNAAIGITKSKTMVWDPINFNSTPKAIPGAIVEYSVVVANTGGAAATLTSIVDNLDTANLDLVTTYFDGGLGTNTPTSSSGSSFQVTCVAGCGARACESAATTSGIAFVTPTITATMATVLPAESTCSAGSLGGGDTVTIKFQVTIK